MTANEIQLILSKQRAFFLSGKTLDVDFRLEALRKLQGSIKAHEADITAALKEDLGKSAFEGYMCEAGLVLSELSFMLRHTRRYSKEKTVITPLAQFHSRSYRKPSPYGNVLIMSPWNYPVLLTFDPLVDALAAGNTAVLKPSAYSPRTSSLIEQIVKECFDEEYVAVVTGGRAENTCLLEQKFDYIFFTGSQQVGKEVMRKAAEHLTPVTLELGGKSPCIIEKTANLKLAAKRVAFGKYLNCGQTCVAPDYILVDRSVKDEFVKLVKAETARQYGEKPLENPDYGKIINEKHFNRILSLIDPSKVVLGGDAKAETLQIEPTVMDNVTFSDKVMSMEIFGPVMPVIAYDSLEDAVAKINSLPHPLALYIFTSSKKTAKKVIAETGFGGGCINDTIIHLATSSMPFGGFGESGMGGYHGKVGFETFSHHKSIVDKKTWLDLPMRYQPYKGLYDKLIHMFLR